jgi:hypothetical protein
LARKKCNFFVPRICGTKNILFIASINTVLVISWHTRRLILSNRVLAVLATVDVSAEATKGALERKAHVGQQYVKHFNLLKSGEQVSFVVDEVNTYAYPYVSTPALDFAILKDMSGALKY